jgi:hypothetical protein
MNILNYTSPKNESSLFKNIPIEYRESAEILSLLASGSYRIRYRGPRHDWLALTTLKADANAFSIYPRDSRGWC